MCYWTMNIHVPCVVCSWIFMSPVMCNHEYSCHPWRVLINIHVTRDGYSWLFGQPWRVLMIIWSPVTCTHEYSCHSWHVLMNFHVIRDVYSWIFMSSVTCTMNIHVTRDVYSWIFMSPVTCPREFQVTREVYKWIFMSPVTCAHEFSCHPWRILMNIHVTHDVYS